MNSDLLENNKIKINLSTSPNQEYYQRYQKYLKTMKEVLTEDSVELFNFNNTDDLLYNKYLEEKRLNR